MIKVLRGVCIGVDRHIVVGQTPPDLEPALVNYLLSIQAIEVVDDPLPEPVPEPEPKSPKKPGKEEK
jgi:hypothetical protein